MPKRLFKMYKATDPFTGEEFETFHPEHYEVVDPTPFAPPLSIQRPTVRQRIENLLNRGVDPLSLYVGTEGIDMDVPEEEDAPLTASEQNFIDLVAASVAEQAPLPDEGLPRAATPPAATPPTPPPAPAPAGVSSPPQAPAPAPGGKPVPT